MDRIKFLFGRWYDGSASEAEKAEFLKLVGEGKLTDELMREKWNDVNGEKAMFFTKVESEKMLRRIVNVRNVKMWKWLSGIAAILLVALGLWFFSREGGKTVRPKDIAQQDVKAPDSTKSCHSEQAQRSEETKAVKR